MRRFSRRSRPVIVVAINETPSQSHLSHSDPPLLIRTRTRTSPPPLVQSRTRVDSEPPRLIPTRIKPINGGIDSLKLSKRYSVKAASVQQSAPPSAITVPAPTSTSNTCFIRAVYQVACHRKYLGAEHGFKDWSELDEVTREAIHSKIQNQFKPAAGDRICTHHLKEFSYVEEPDPNSADKDRGACSGYGIVHKVIVLTTRLGVLTYFNGIAGKNRDALPGKFVCSTCIKILRGKADAFMPSTPSRSASSPAEPVKRKGVAVLTSESNRSQRPRLIHPSPNNPRPNSSSVQLDEKEAMSIDIEEEAEETEFRFCSLQPSEIIVTEFGASTANTNEEPEPEQDPLESNPHPSQIEAETEEEMELKLEPPTPVEVVDDGAPRFQRLNTILATAGVAPLVVQNSSTTPQEEEILRCRAATKIRQLVQHCVKLCKIDGIEVEINAQSFYNSFALTRK